MPHRTPPSVSRQRNKVVSAEESVQLIREGDSLTTGGFELRPNSIVNLGIGMPEGIANVANEEGKAIDLGTAANGAP